MRPTAHPVTALVFLSGPRRGETLRLDGESLSIGSSRKADIHLPPTTGEGEIDAWLMPRGNSYELIVSSGTPVWVNGEPVERLVLASGDVLEIGRPASVLRFRAYPPGSPAWKTMAEAFADCLDCARVSSPSAIGRTVAFLTRAPRELATQTLPAFRVLMALTLLLMVAIVFLAANSLRLRRELISESERITLISELLEKSEREAIRKDDLDIVRSQLGGELEATSQRLEALEERSEATSRIIRQASPSVVFLQGSYGFNDPASGRPLRFVASSDGGPGSGAVGFDGDGPRVESLYTGTAFVVSPDGLLITNRHVARPWETEAAAQALVQRGLRPVMYRFIGYLPGRAESVTVGLASVADEADVAVLRIEEEIELPEPLPFASAPPTPGDEVIVLGYPTGMRALLARTDTNFVDRLREGPPLDFWSVAQQLSLSGQIGPLASRGIVSQVSSAAVVYDAETYQGGSGGPVLGLDGQVLAVSSAVVPEFGGSNLGVPAAQGERLLAEATAGGVDAIPR